MVSLFVFYLILAHAYPHFSGSSGSSPTLNWESGSAQDFCLLIKQFFSRHCRLRARSRPARHVKCFEITLLWCGPIQKKLIWFDFEADFFASSKVDISVWHSKWTIFQVCWIYFIHPFGKEPMERVGIGLDRMATIQTTTTKKALGRWLNGPSVYYI